MTITIQLHHVSGRHPTLAQESADRETFLENASGADSELRGEVASLMAAHEKAGSFGATPVTMPSSLLARGMSLGCYRITGFIGAGGMDEVYRARDSRLDRDVALKVLPAHLQSSAERLARLGREARLLASLNHPHIAAIYGVEESDGIRALVMELVDGEDLSERLTRGAIAPAAALLIARQIADGLEAAHERGIAHRDLKPANIKIREDGAVKVLDFGLATALEATPGVAPDASSAATVSEVRHPSGGILGTAAYMSPEQAEGKHADKRADIWAFGVVFHEMLTGHPLYSGDTAEATRAQVIELASDVSILPAATPATVRELIRRCLVKDPRNRLQAIGEARIVLDDAIARTRAPHEARSAAAADRARTVPLPIFAWSLALACAAGITAAATWRSAPEQPALRLSVDLGTDARVATGVSDALAISPDGSVIAFVGHQDSLTDTRLYVRSLRDLHATALAGTEDASSPFFSPDGEWMGFFAAGELKKISIRGGAAVSLCNAPNGRGGDWGTDDTIVFSPDSQWGVRLLRVSSAGGTPQPVTPLEAHQRWPQILPGGRAVLYTADGSAGAFNDSNIVVQRFPAGPRTVVQRRGYHGRYVETGHLVYVRDGTLFATPFDLDRLEVTGPPTPVVEGVTSNAGSASAQFALSENGTLVHMPGQTSGGEVPIHVLDRDGDLTLLHTTPTNWFNPLISPDGARIAVQINNQGQNDLWLIDWWRDTTTRLTFHPADDEKPVWSPDSLRIAFASKRADPSAWNLYWLHADGTGEPQRLTTSTHPQFPTSWHPSGTFLAFEEQSTDSAQRDVLVLPIQIDARGGVTAEEPMPLLNSASDEREATFSPDGRWLAYVSDESGRNEIYVRPFPGPGGKWQISSGGGSFPTWSRTRRELFYGASGRIMVAGFAVEGESFRAERPRMWTATRYTARGLTRMFDLHPAGDRIALAAALDMRPGIAADKLVLTLNFFDDLRRLAPSR